jgi:hypothetical protein
MEYQDRMNKMKRVRYFSGQVLSTEDLQTEQNYFLEKRKRHNRLLHGSGVVFGLEVSIEGQKVQVSPGFALDCTGEEIAVTEAVTIAPPDSARFSFLMIAYKEHEVDEVPGAGDGSAQPSRIEESFELLFEPDDPYVGHVGDTTMWVPCNHIHALPLAKLVRRWETWEVDPWFEPPGITR